VNANDDTSVTFAGAVTPEMRARALRSLRRATLGTLSAGVILGAGLLIFAAAMGLSESSPPWRDLSLLLIVEAAFASLYWQLRRAASRLFRDGVAQSAAATGRADEETFELKTDLGLARYPWKVFYKSLLTSSEVLLYQAPQQAVLVPRELFASDDDWRRFAELIESHGPPPVKGSRGGRGSLGTLLLWLALVAGILLYLRWFRTGS
jgi:hypothetical protein